MLLRAYNMQSYCFFIKKEESLRKNYDYLIIPCGRWYTKDYLLVSKR